MSKHLLSFYWLSFLSIILCVCVCVPPVRCALLSPVHVSMCASMSFWRFPPTVSGDLHSAFHPSVERSGIFPLRAQRDRQQAYTFRNCKRTFFIANNLKWANCAQECIFRLIRWKLWVFGGYLEVISASLWLPEAYSVWWCVIFVSSVSHSRTESNIQQDLKMRSGVGLCVLGLLGLLCSVFGQVRRKHQISCSET